MSARPGASAGDQVSRLLKLVPYALTRREVPIQQAAADLGVTPAQLVADLKVLMFCGWPGYLPGDLIEVDLDALEGEGTVRVTNADYLARPLRLSVREASALIVALRTLRDAAVSDVAPVVDRVLHKLETAAEDGARAAQQVEVHVGDAERTVAASRAELAAAVERGRQVRLDYYVPARDEVTTRVVDPLALVAGEGMTYLDAWCHRVADRRLFRLDRIEALSILDSPVDQHPDAAPRDLSAGLFQPSDTHETATLRLLPPARWVAEYYPVTRVDEAEGGSLVVRMKVADRRWLRQLLLRLAPNAVLLEPEEIGREFTTEAQEALSLYT